MITLIATPMDVFGHVRFIIEVDDRVHACTDDALDAANALDRLGVQDALRFIDHVREWGFVELQAGERSARPHAQRPSGVRFAFTRS